MGRNPVPADTSDKAKHPPEAEHAHDEHEEEYYSGDICSDDTDDETEDDQPLP